MTNLETFPSPCGDYGSYLDDRADDLDYFPNSFRPLAGIMVLIVRAYCEERQNGIDRFRPLAGIMVLIGNYHRHTSL